MQQILITIHIFNVRFLNSSVFSRLQQHLNHTSQFYSYLHSEGYYRGVYSYIILLILDIHKNNEKL